MVPEETACPSLTPQAQAAVLDVGPPEPHAEAAIAVRAPLQPTAAAARLAAVLP